jgi:UDP-3-O-[3-hydroxymyristoyl] glucosamine N-acyltransferase
MMTLQQIAEMAGAVLCGDGLVEITGVETLSAARPGDLTFVVHTNYLSRLSTTQASAVIVSSQIAQRLGDQRSRLQVLVSDDPLAAFRKIARCFRPVAEAPGPGISCKAIVSHTARIDPTATICPGSFIGDEVTIGAGSVVYPGVVLLERCRIGDGVRIFPNAVLYEGTVVGNRCVVHANAVLGAWGFGYERSANGHMISEQLGYVELADDVEIGSCATVDRGTYGATRVGKGSKLDNHVMIGHNCQIGAHNLLCSQVGIAGSSTTGDFVVMAGQAGIADNVNIGSHSVICAQTGVMNDLEPNKTWLGSPAMDARDKLQIFAAESRLPEMRRELRRLERQLAQLAEAISRQKPSAETGEPAPTLKAA